MLNLGQKPKHSAGARSWPAILFNDNDVTNQFLWISEAVAALLLYSLHYQAYALFNLYYLNQLCLINSTPL